MTLTHSRIGKVRLKKNSNIAFFPQKIDNAKTYNLSWGEITFRMYDHHPITHETMMYMLRAAEDKILNE